MTNTLPEILYHYTTADGLLGICKENALWATKIHYLNDSSELVEPLNIASKYLETTKTKNNSQRVKDSEIDEIVQSMLYDLEISAGLNIFVSSFCTKGDLLSQWRAYGSADSAYSIGFQTNKLVEILGKHTFELHRCIYYDSAKYVSEIELFIEEYINTNKKDKIKWETFILEFFKMASTMKHNCFEEEDEYRIISIEPIKYTHERVNFRPGKFMLIPYYSLPLGPTSIIKNITIGPCQHPNLSGDAVQGLAYRCGFYDSKMSLLNIEVLTSEIPFRHI